MTNGEAGSRDPALCPIKRHQSRPDIFRNRALSVRRLHEGASFSTQTFGKLRFADQSFGSGTVFVTVADSHLARLPELT